MIQPSTLDELRDFIADVPRGTKLDEIVEWLAEAGMPATGQRPAVTGPTTLVVFASDEGNSIGVYAVPDREISPSVRAAIAAWHGRVFAFEDICDDSFAGALWLLAHFGPAAPPALLHLAGSVPSIDPIALLAARGAWETHWIDNTAALATATITACYTARLAT